MMSAHWQAAEKRPCLPAGICYVVRPPHLLGGVARVAFDSSRRHSQDLGGLVPRWEAFLSSLPKTTFSATGQLTVG